MHPTNMKPNHLQSLDPRTQQAKHKEQIEKKALLDRAFDRIIGSQLHKIKAANNNDPTEQDETKYQETLERERAAASQRKAKKLSKEHAELARTTGLSGQVVALMAQVEEKKKRKSKKRSKRDYSDDSSSSSNEDSYERRKRRHKEKKRKRKSERRVDGDSIDSDESRDQRRHKKEKKRKRSKSRSPKPEDASKKRDTSRSSEA
jgi:hypothetical protein